MAFNQQFHPLSPSGLSYPRMSGPPGRHQNPSWHSAMPWQAASQQPQHRYVHTPDHYSRRSSHATQCSSNGMQSPTASITPNLTWTPTSLYITQMGSPAVNNDSFQSFANYSYPSPRSITSVRPVHMFMNADAPSFTPRSKSSSLSQEPYRSTHDPKHGPVHTAKQSPSGDDSNILPRVHRTAPSFSLSTHRPIVTPMRSPLM